LKKNIALFKKTYLKATEMPRSKMQQSVQKFDVYNCSHQVEVGFEIFPSCQYSENVTFSFIFWFQKRTPANFGITENNCRRPSLYAVILSAISSICDPEMTFFLEPIL